MIRVPVLDGPMMVQADVLAPIKGAMLERRGIAIGGTIGAARRQPVRQYRLAIKCRPCILRHGERIAVAPPRVPNASEQQKDRQHSGMRGRRYALERR